MELDRERTLVERIREVWEESLGTTVDDRTDFFDANGHSFMAIRIISRLDSSYQAKLPLRMLFDNPRFDRFVGAVARHLRAAEQVPAVDRAP
jgi:acyl carrier protein